MTVNNDFHDRTTIFEIFKDLKLDQDVLDKQVTGGSALNGNHVSEPATNGKAAVAAS
jgi:hypothetical protein